MRAAQVGSETALNDLLENYRAPLLAWLRCRQISREDAEDLVQGLLSGLVRRDFLKELGQEKGRFRAFILSCLKNHLRDSRDKAKAFKRGGSVPLDSLDEIGPDGRPTHDLASTAAAADLEFDRVWGRTILENSLRRLEGESARTGHKPLCAALEPVLFADETSLSYRQIAESLGLTEGAVKVAAHRLRARLRGIIREEVRQTVQSEGDLEKELRELLTLFGPRPTS